MSAEPVRADVDDQWRHRVGSIRSVRMRCSTCMWFVEKLPLTEIKADKDEWLGRCRRRAPTMNGYPAVFSLDWCGDHKLDENKI